MKNYSLPIRRIGNVPAVAALGVMLLLAAQAEAARRDLSSPKKAVETFNEAFRNGDLVVARAATVNEARTNRLVEQLLAYGKQLRRLLTGGTGPDYVDLNQTSIALDGDSGVVLEDSRVVGMVRKVGAQWKFDPASGLPGDAADSAAAAVGQLSRVMERVV